MSFCQISGSFVCLMLSVSFSSSLYCSFPEKKHANKKIVLKNRVIKKLWMEAELMDSVMGPLFR